MCDGVLSSLYSLDRCSPQGIPVASVDPGCVQALQLFNLNPRVVWSVVWPSQLEAFCCLS